MKSKCIQFIINESSDKEKEIPALINELFKDSAWTYDITWLKDYEAITNLAKHWKADDLIAVYGGDGTATEVAKALIGSNMPLMIIPGGTANVLSKELNIPQDAKSALTLLRDREFELKTIDTGLVNGQPFLLRINLGIMATMITDVNPTVKEHTGQLAYGLSTLKAVHDAKPQAYNLLIDGQHVDVSAVSLTVTNSGHMGIGSLQMQPGISITDGLLDLVILKDADVLSLLKAAGSSLLEQETDAVSHRALKKIVIKMLQEENYICDDCEAKANELTIEVVPASLNVVIPLIV